MQEKNDKLNTEVRYLKGVGPKKSRTLADIGIGTVEDILYYLPMRYEDRSNFTAIKDLKMGEYQTVRGDIVTALTRLSKSGMTIFELVVADGSGFVRAVWFNQPYLAKLFLPESKVIFYGKSGKGNCFWACPSLNISPISTPKFKKNVSYMESLTRSPTPSIRP